MRHFQEGHMATRNKNQRPQQMTCCEDYHQVERSGKTFAHIEPDPEDEYVNRFERYEAIARPQEEEEEEWNPPAVLGEWFPLPIKQRRHEEMVARMEADARMKAAAASRATVRFRGRSVTATAMRA
jgi:hypothetical protein